VIPSAPRIARVSPDLRAGPPAALYDYLIPTELQDQIRLGQRVVVPFGRRRVFGFVVELLNESPIEELRPLERIRDEEPLLLPHQITLAQWIASHYLCPLPEVLRAMIPPALRTGKATARRRAASKRPAADSAAMTGSDAPLKLTPAQEEAFAPIRDAVTWSRAEEFLLFGVTGSGKTEVYLAAIKAALAQGKGAIVLVPEISLTPQTEKRFAVHFPGIVAVLHSGLTVAERGREWRRVRAGQAQVVVGSRSAIFAPMANPGVVIVDEEDSSSYKQYDAMPRYQAADVARHLGRVLSVPVVLGSATPRLEAYRQAVGDKGLRLLRMSHRFGGRPLPPVEIVDLREELAWGNRSPFSRRLAELVSETLREGGQGILFLNRRGTSSVVLCRSCGEALGCPCISRGGSVHATTATTSWCSLRRVPAAVAGCSARSGPAPSGSKRRPESCGRRRGSCGWTETRSGTATPTGRSTRPSCAVKPTF
jgi:primosomal protein N' (replication factor Y)